MPQMPKTLLFLPKKWKRYEEINDFFGKSVSFVQNHQRPGGLGR
jgi:hypothetical protein